MINPYLVTPPEGLPVSLVAAKAQCRHNADFDLEDDLIERLIWTAYQHAEHYQQRTLLESVLQIRLDHFPRVITLPRPKLREVVSITYVSLSGAVVTLDPADYVVDADSQPGLIYPAYGKCFPQTRCQPNAVTIRWEAGYDSIPPATESAILLLVGHLFENREGVIVGTISGELPYGISHLLDLDCWGAAL
jgi:uncharacterized phiE125 gp8 family phage protein